MIKKFLACAIVMLAMCSSPQLNAIKEGEHPICITPSFEFRCFIDNFSVPGMVSFMSAILGVYYLHKSLYSYINRQTTPLNDHERVPEDIMIGKAKNYGLAATLWAAISAALYFREPIKAGLMRIPHLLRR